MSKKAVARAMTMEEYGEYLDYVDSFEKDLSIGPSKRLFQCAKWVVENIYPSEKGNVTVARMSKLFADTISKTLEEEDADLKN